MNKRELELIYTFILIIILLIMFFSVIIYYMYKESSNVKISTELSPITIKKEIDVNPVEDPVYPLEGMDYQQLGTLSTIDSDNPIVLPLYGKRKYRQRWTYYTISNNDKNLRIEIEFENRGCMKDRIGCDMIYDGSIVKIPIYNDKEFRVSLYDIKMI